MVGMVDGGHLHTLMDLDPGLRRPPGEVCIVALPPGEVERLRKVSSEGAIILNIDCVCRPGTIDQSLLPEGWNRQREDPIEEPDRLLAEAAPADFIPGIRPLLKEGHPVTEFSEQVGSGASGRSAPNNNGIIVRPIYHHLPSCRQKPGTY